MSTAVVQAPLAGIASANFALLLLPTTMMGATVDDHERDNQRNDDGSDEADAPKRCLRAAVATSG